MQLGGVSSPKYRTRFTEALVPALPAVIKACSNMFRATFESLFWVSPLRMTFMSSGRERFFVVRLRTHRLLAIALTIFPQLEQF